MPVEDGMRKAIKNLDEAAGAAPASKVIHPNDPEQQHDDDRNKNREVKQNEAEAHPTSPTSEPSA